MAGMEGLAAGILSLWHMTIQNDHHVYENLRLYDIYVSKYMLVFCRSQRGNWVRRLKLKFSGKFTTLMPKIRIIQCGGFHNGGTPNSSILMRFSLTDHPFGVSPFMETPMFSKIRFHSVPKIMSNVSLHFCDENRTNKSGDLLGSYVTISMIFAFVVNFAYGWGPIVS